MKSDWIYKRGGSNRLFSWLDIDSWIDSSLYQSYQHFKSRWNATSDWFAAKFRLTGRKRLLNEVLSEAATLGSLSRR